MDYELGEGEEVKKKELQCRDKDTNRDARREQFIIGRGASLCLLCSRKNLDSLAFSP